ncbi:MAG: polysaccharide biosynthesis protein [Candidatus Latescibacteria bacterium]|nr:polysaccharide biosynthesis protein [Candidatus Latescibacterota bacterium]
MLNALPLIVSVKLMSFSFFNFKRISSDFFGLRDLFETSARVVFSSLLLFILSLFVVSISLNPLVFLLDATFTLSLLVAYHLLTSKIFKRRKTQIVDKAIRTLIIGAGETSELLLKSLKNKGLLNLKLLGILDDDKRKTGHCLYNIPILGPISNLDKLINDLEIQKIIIAIPSLAKKKLLEIVARAETNNVMFTMVPSYEEITNSRIENDIEIINNLHIEDLTDRQNEKIDIQSIASIIKNKNILITGAAGRVGSEIARQLLKFYPKSILILDQKERELYHLYTELKNLNQNTQIEPIIANITNKQRIKTVFENHCPHIVFHAASYSNEYLMERNTQEIVNNNIYGTKVIADQSLASNIEHFVYISSDEATFPNHVVGLTKRVAEKYIQSLSEEANTKLISIRLNRTSNKPDTIHEIARSNILEGFLCYDEAIKLMLHAVNRSNSGEIFLLDLSGTYSLLEKKIGMSELELRNYINQKPLSLSEDENSEYQAFQKTIHPQIFLDRRNGFAPDVVKRFVQDILNLDTHTEKFIEIARNFVPELSNDSLSD